MLSEERKEELKKAAEEAEELVRYLGKLPELNTHWYIFLLYLSSQDLVKHSENLVKGTKTLNRWTKAITFIGGAMIIAVIAQIFVMINLR